MDLQQLTAGNTLNFATAVPAYPASAGWVLHYRLVPRSGAGAAITLDAVAEGDAHRVQAPASTTAAWAAGAYSWASWVTRALESYSVETGQITIQPDPRTASAWDSRSQARKALDDAKAALAAWTPTRRRYKIGEREMEFNAPGEIIKLITYWEQQVASEDMLAGRRERPARRIHARI
jgi:enamine deaminase RidA (YjgF/YER057c/UK114 family)